MLKRIYIQHTDGTETPLTSCPSPDKIRGILGGLMELVRVLDHIRPDGRFAYSYMVVDDEGMLKNAPINPMATEIYLANAKAQIERGVSEELFGDMEDAHIHGDALIFQGYTCEEVDDAIVAATIRAEKGQD